MDHVHQLLLIHFNSLFFDRDTIFPEGVCAYYLKMLYSKNYHVKNKMIIMMLKA